MSVRHAGLAAATTLLMVVSILEAATVPPPPDPGLTASLQAADAIVEVEIIAGGPFRSAAAVRRVYRGQPPRVIELVGYNSLNWDATSAAFETGSRWILFLSRTDRDDVYATLTPSAPRLPLKDGSVLLSLGDPPFRLPVAEGDLSAALELIAHQRKDGDVADRDLAFLRMLWARNEVEARYLATALAGLLGDARAVPLLAESARDKLLRLRLTAVESLSRIGTPEALAVLRGLLNDERELVAREAAVALIEAQDAEAIPGLLEWARRTAEAKAKLAEDDARRKKSAQYINQLLLLLLDLGPLESRQDFVDGLFALARSPDAETATTALFVLDRLAGRKEIGRLLELAEDPVYAHAQDAAAALFRSSLQPVVDVRTFRAWWLLNRETFGEQTRVKRVREAAMSLALGTNDPEVGLQLGVLLSAPPEMALPEITHLLLDRRGQLIFEPRHLSAWRGPLTLPFLLERLTAADAQERATALQALAVLLHRHPRLASGVLPLVRAQLADPEPLVRRLACSACGMLGDARALPGLFQALDNGVSYETNEAAQAVFDLSARTLGYAYHELAEDNEVAVRRLAAWWKALGANGQAAWTSPLQRSVRPASTLQADVLERFVTGEESRPSGAAFAILLTQRAPTDPLWGRLQASERARDRAHGVLGRFGAPEGAASELAPILKSSGSGTDLPRAVCIPVMASLRGARGPDLLVEWLEGPGEEASIAWRRLAVVSLGMSEGEPKSLAWLQQALAEGLAKESDPLLAPADPPDEKEALLPAVMLALAARSDGVTALSGALKSQVAGRREWAVRALALRHHSGAMDEMLTALDKADRYTVYDMARAVCPLPKAEHAEALARLLADGTESGRLAAAVILSRRPDLGTTSALRGALVQAIQDMSSYVRARAAEALGRLRARAAVPSLLLLLNDVATEPKTAAIEALGRIGDRDAARAAAGETRLYSRIDPRWMPVLGLSDEADDIRVLMTAAQSESWIERRGALRGLGRSRRPEALKHLLGVFREARSPYRTHAGDALATRASDALEALSNDFKADAMPVRAAALFWLNDVPLSDASSDLIQALRDGNPGIRQLADWLLRRKTGKAAGFDYQAPDGQREERIKQWEAILKSQ